VAVSDEPRVRFLQAAHEARDKLAGQIVPADLLSRVQSLLADYRSEHR
jgi:hypothetical protein